MITKRPKVVILFVGFMLLGALGLSALAIGSGKADGTVDMDLRFAGNGNGNDTVDMNLRFAGTFLNSIQYVAPGAVETTGSPLIHLHAKGSPGPCEITLFGGSDEVAEFPSDCCGSEFPGGGGPACLLISITENPLVFTFTADLSLLFATGAGEFCLDLLTGSGTGTVDLIFTGGRGRFEGATGEAVTVFEIEPVSSEGALSAETGQTVGTILLPDDDD